MITMQLTTPVSGAFPGNTPVYHDNLEETDCRDTCLADSECTVAHANDIGKLTIKDCYIYRNAIYSIPSFETAANDIVYVKYFPGTSGRYMSYFL